jgi:hypothetical protein
MLITLNISLPASQISNARPHFVVSDTEDAFNRRIVSSSSAGHSMVRDVLCALLSSCILKGLS